MDAVIATQYGEMPIEVLRRSGIVPVEDRGAVIDALRRAVGSVFKERAAVFK